MASYSPPSPQPLLRPAPPRAPPRPCSASPRAPPRPSLSAAPVLLHPSVTSVSPSPDRPQRGCDLALGRHDGDPGNHGGDPAPPYEATHRALRLEARSGGPLRQALGGGGRTPNHREGVWIGGNPSHRQVPDYFQMGDPRARPRRDQQLRGLSSATPPVTDRGTLVRTGMSGHRLLQMETTCRPRMGELQVIWD